jgi:hypothetical protein
MGERGRECLGIPVLFTAIGAKGTEDTWVVSINCGLFLDLRLGPLRENTVSRSIEGSAEWGSRSRGGVLCCKVGRRFFWASHLQVWLTKSYAGFLSFLLPSLMSKSTCIIIF